MVNPAVVGSGAHRWRTQQGRRGPPR